MRCTNTESLNKYLSGEEQAEKENEKYELEFLEILSNLKIYAIKNDKLELLKDLIKEEFNLWKHTYTKTIFKLYIGIIKKKGLKWQKI